MSNKCADGMLVVVSTGAEARMFTWSSSNSGSLAHIGTLEPTNLLGEGPSGVRPPESSQQSTDEATFAKQLANHLYAEAHKGAYQHLALIADPRTLGEMRPQLHKEVLDRLDVEIAKTMIHSTTEDIVKALNEHTS